MEDEEKKKKQQQKANLKYGFPKLTCKDWDIFLAALVFRVPEHVDLKNNNKTTTTLEGVSPLFS